jgi:hypothetical protein
MMQPKPLLLAMSIVCLVGSAGARSQSIDMPPTAPNAIELLAGRYAYVGNPERDHATIQKSIDAAISNLGWLGRKIAGNRLANHKELPERIEISQLGEDISIVMGSYAAVAPADGSPRALVGPNGRDAKLHYELETDTIVQYFVFEHATRKSTYSFDQANNLVMTVYMTSQKLAHPIEYALVYAPRNGE